MPRNAYEFQLQDGPRIVIAELTPSEVLTAMRAAGAKALGAETRLECVRHALREVDGRKVGYPDVAGMRLVKECLPRSRHQSAAMLAFARLHEPSHDEVEAMKAAIATELGADGERWTVRLPGGRIVVLAERDQVTVAQAMERARGSAKAESVMQLQGLLEGLRASIVEVDGRAPDIEGKKLDAALSMKEILLLGVAWQDLHVCSAEPEPVGEPRPVGGTR